MMFTNSINGLEVLYASTWKIIKRNQILNYTKRPIMGNIVFLCKLMSKKNSKINYFFITIYIFKLSHNHFNIYSSNKSPRGSMASSNIFSQMKSLKCGYEAI